MSHIDELQQQLAQAYWAVARIKADLDSATAPKFKVGDWVVQESFCQRAMQINLMNKGYVFAGGCWLDTSRLRHATTEEIAKADRIEPKVGMLLKRKSDGSVWRVWCAYSEMYLDRIDVSTSHVTSIFQLTHTDYDILDSYTLQGVK